MNFIPGSGNLAIAVKNWNLLQHTFPGKITVPSLFARTEARVLISHKFEQTNQKQFLCFSHKPIRESPVVEFPRAVLVKAVMRSKEELWSREW